MHPERLDANYSCRDGRAREIEGDAMRVRQSISVSTRARRVAAACSFLRQNRFYFLGVSVSPEATRWPESARLIGRLRFRRTTDYQHHPKRPALVRGDSGDRGIPESGRRISGFGLTADTIMKFISGLPR